MNVHDGRHFTFIALSPLDGGCFQPCAFAISAASAASTSAKSHAKGGWARVTLI